MKKDKIEFIKGILKSNGYNLTEQRKIITEIFLRNPSKHFSPKELYQILEKNNSFIGQATVYRNLKILTKVGVLEEISSDDKKLYELKIFGKKSVHTHCYCLNCGSIINHSDISTSLKLISIIERIQEKYEFKVEKLDIIFYCSCKNCKLHKENVYLSDSEK